MEFWISTECGVEVFVTFAEMS